MLAFKRMEKNWAKVAQNILIVTYTALMIFDMGVIIFDAPTGQTDKTPFAH